jgi:hypothetical protein
VARTDHPFLRAFSPSQTISSTAQIGGYVRASVSLVITGCDVVCPTHGQRGPLIGLTGAAAH